MRLVLWSLYSSVLLLLLATRRHSSAATVGVASTTWRWCGHVRTATRRPAHFRLAATAGTAAQTAHGAVAVKPNGDLLCRCSAHSSAPTTELTLIVGSEEASNMTDTTTAVLSILDPCVIAVCQHADPLHLRRAPRVHVLPPKCGMSAHPQQVADDKFEVILTTNFSSQSCTRPDEHGQLVITQHPHRTHPHLVVQQAFPLSIISCTSVRPTTTPISLLKLQSVSPAEISQRLRRQGTAPLHFDHLYYIVRVRENSPIGTEVATVSVSEPDSGGLEITYSMTAVDAHSTQLFSLHPTTGVMTTAGDIDREDVDKHVYRVTAQDGGGAELTVSYTIEVEDENDNSPTFQHGSYYTFSIREDHTPGAPCESCSVTVIDGDAGSNGQVSYQLLNNTGGAFTVYVLGNQAMLRPARELDYETLSHYRLTLLASDEGDNPHTSTAAIEVLLVDVADNPPVFNSSTYLIPVPEDTALGSHLLTVHATSLDSGLLGIVQYYVVGGDPESRFHLDPSTGRLTLLDHLDFENTERYALSVQAQSGQGPGVRLKSLVTVTIEVLNVNDHQPTFGRTQYSVSVPEGIMVGHHVVGVSAEDLDSGDYGLVTYGIELTESDPGIEITFDLDSDHGGIRTLVTLDHEEREMYEMVVVARDGGQPARSASIKVIIRVSDVNDEKPVFSQQTYGASIAEDASVHVAVVNVSAEDSDSPAVEYLIESGNIENKFHLDQTSGLITVSGSLDRERTPSYVLTVVATDGQLEATVPVHITVTDVNDKRPIFTNAYVSTEVSESLPTGDEVTRVTAVDGDDIGMNSLMTYFSDNIPPVFSLDSTSGIVTLASSLDYDTEYGKYYFFDVNARDGGSPPLSSTARVEVLVRDENDNLPVFLSGPTQTTVKENAREHTSVLQLTATDKDDGSNAALSFSITGDYRAMQVFGVGASGMIYTTQPLDREVQEVYSVRVQVTDGGREPLSSSITVSVTIEDEIDYPPVFDQVIYELQVTAPTDRGTLLVTLRAATKDDVPSSSILYTITSGTGHGLFSMDQSLGEIRAANALHPQLHTGVYDMQVTAQHQHLTETVPVVVTIREADGIPRLQPLTIYFNVLNSLLETGPTDLGGVQVLEEDELRQTYNFALAATRDQRVFRYFDIGEEFGNVSVDGSVSPGHYLLNVSVSSPTGVGYGEVNVFVHVVSNSTLQNAVVAVFANTEETEFAAIHLDRFAQFVMDIIPCTREQVEVFGIEQSDTQPANIDIAFAVRQADMQAYIPSETIIDRLHANQHQAHPPTLLEFDSLVCVSEPCPNLQLCQPILHLYSYTPQTPTKRMDLTDMYYLSHPFNQSHVCSCPPGYSLEGLCHEEVNECQNNPCHFGSPCIDLVNDFLCECPESTLGKDCGVVCPSPSCLPCFPSPCLHGGECTVSSMDPSSASCQSCPWAYSGPLCELTSLYFSPGSFAAFSPLGSTHKITLSFGFATVTPSGLLLFNGHVSGSYDFIAVELVIGQVKVSVSFGEEPILSLETESLRLLNDGQWHTVEIQLNTTDVLVSVSSCSTNSERILGEPDYCQLAGLVPSQRRSLDVSGPLYVGGIETHIPTGHLSGTTYHGCISSLTIEHQLLDFSTPVRAQGTRLGCPPRDVTCEGQTSGECVEVWNGTVVGCQGDDCSVAPHPVQLSGGYLQLDQEMESAVTVVEEFSVQFRTWDSSAVLAHFEQAASLEIRHGSVLYWRSQTKDLTAVTLVVDAFVSDGLWHTVKLTADDIHALSVDAGRVEATQPVGGRLRVSSITLGAAEPDAITGQFTGCIDEVVVNGNRLDFSSATGPGEHLVGIYTVTSANVTVGCEGGGACQGVQCPVNSECREEWFDYSCQCRDQFRLMDNGCVDPCDPNPCQNGGTCSSLPGFQCQCEPQYEGMTCERMKGEACPIGLYRDLDDECQLCLCDYRGVEGVVCDADTGDCVCQDGIPVFSPSEDLSCQPCTCNPLGSTSPECDPTTGQCPCRANVTGRSCDQCREGMAGMDHLGCTESTDLFGSFVLSSVAYTAAYAQLLSPDGSQLAGNVGNELRKELNQFGLPGLQEVSLTSVTNSSTLSQVHYHVSAYLQRGSGVVSRPSIHTLASVVQLLVQSGWVGSYQTQPTSHRVDVRCACERESDCYAVSGDELQPFGCLPCDDRQLDGVICRAEVPQSCSGPDRDRDGVPDVCDDCPHTFNPSQRAGDCPELEGVCGAEEKSGRLWSPTGVGTHDVKLCRLPYKGYSTRECVEGGRWSYIDETECVSPEGQQAELLAESLEQGQLLTQDEADYASMSLATFAGGETISGGDLQAIGRLLAGLIQLQRLRGNDTSSDTLKHLTETGSHLLDPIHATQWVGVASDSNFSPEELLSALEQMALLAFDLQGSSRVSEDFLFIETVSIGSVEFSGHVFKVTSARGTVSTVEVPSTLIGNISSNVGLVIAHMPNIGPLLPLQPSFDNLTVGGPVLSVQLEGVLPPSPLPTPITITFGYIQQVLREGDLGSAVCVYWECGSGWSRDGCWVVASNITHTTCQCSHLTPFTVLVPATTFMEVPPPTPSPYTYDPAEFTYVVFGIVFVLLLVTLCVLICLRSIQSLHNSVHKHFIASMAASGIVFITTIDRTEEEAVCSVFAVLLFFLLLSTLSWLLSEFIVISWLYLQPQLSTKETWKARAYLYAIGWVVPFLLCGIATGVIAIVSHPFSEQFGYPHFCWLSSDLIWAFAGPAALLVIANIVAILVALWLTARSQPPSPSPSTTPVANTLTKHKARVSVFILTLLLIFYILTWLFGILAVYGHEFSDSASQSFEYLFAILYATMGVFVFIVLTLNSKVREGCSSQFHRKDEGIVIPEDAVIEASYLRAHLHSRIMPHTGLPNITEPQESPPVPMMTHPLNENKLRPLPPLSPSKSLKHSPIATQPAKETQSRWYVIPEATPLSPLTYNSEADGSSETTDAEQRDSVSELYRETRQSSPESYLEYSHECEQAQRSPVSPKTAEDPLWYRPRDSVGPSEQLQIEMVPMPYETVVRPPPSPQRSVKWKDLEQTDSHASPHLSERSSTRAEEGSGSSHSSPRTVHDPRRAQEGSASGSSHSSPGAVQRRALEGTSSSHSSPRFAPRNPNNLPHVGAGRTMSDGPLLPLPNPQRGTLSLQRRPPAPTYPSHPAMSRTVSDNLPRQWHLPPHNHQVTRRASESIHSRGRELLETYPPSSSSMQVSRVSSASGPSPSMGTRRPARQAAFHKNNLESSDNHESGGEQETSLSGTYHSNGPSVEGSINQVIRHADGSETKQSLV